MSRIIELQPIGAGWKVFEGPGVEPVFVQGLRYTDDRTLAIAERILCGRINKRLVDALESFDCQAIGLNSLTSCVLFADRLYLEGPENRRIDVGLARERSARWRVI